MSAKGQHETVLACCRYDATFLIIIIQSTQRVYKYHIWKQIYNLKWQGFVVNKLIRAHLAGQEDNPITQSVISAQMTIDIWRSPQKGSFIS